MRNFRTFQLAKEQYKTCEKLKAPHYVQDQLRRAALSVCLNLAEGSAKTSVKDRRRFYEIALASHREVQTLLDILQAEELIRKADALGGGLYNLNRALRAELKRTA